MKKKPKKQTNKQTNRLRNSAIVLTLCKIPNFRQNVRHKSHKRLSMWKYLSTDVWLWRHCFFQLHLNNLEYIVIHLLKYIYRRLVHAVQLSPNKYTKCIQLYLQNYFANRINVKKKTEQNKTELTAYQIHRIMTPIQMCLPEYHWPALKQLYQRNCQQKLLLPYEIFQMVVPIVTKQHVYTEMLHPMTLCIEWREGKKKHLRSMVIISFGINFFLPRVDYLEDAFNYSYSN